MAYQRNRDFGYDAYVSGSITLNPTEDARIDQSSNTTNYGSDTTSPLRFHNAVGGFARHFYMKFDLSGYRAIDSATLRIYINSVEAANSICVHESTNNSWVEGTITWDTAPGFNPGTIAATYVDTASQYVEFDVTDYCARNPNSIISFTLRPSPLNNNTFNIDTSEGTNPPELVLNYGGESGKLPNLPIVPNMAGYGVNFSCFGWDVYTVTNNDASGAGSFTDALSQPNRVVIFETSGVFPWNNSEMFPSNIVIAGQTAPGPVVIDGAFLGVHGSNIIIQHCTIWTPTGATDGILYGDSADSVHQTNIVLDHCWIPYGRDECTDIWNKLANSNFHYEYCIIGPPATDLTSGRGSLTGGDPEAYMNVSFNKCLFTQAYERNPLAKTASTVINNCMVYNWGALPVYVSQRELNHITETSIINCFFAEGPDTTQSKAIVLDSNSWETGSQVYINGNTYEGLTIIDEWSDLVNENGITGAQTLSPLPTYENLTSIASSAVETDLTTNAGPRPSDRFTELTTIITGITARTGAFVTANGGVPPALPTLTPSTITHTVPANDVLDARGYTPLQRWLVELAETPPVAEDPNTPITGWSVNELSGITAPPFTFVANGTDDGGTMTGEGNQVGFFQTTDWVFGVHSIPVSGAFDLKFRIDSMVEEVGGTTVQDLWVGCGFFNTLSGDTDGVVISLRQETGGNYLERKSWRNSVGGIIQQNDSAGTGGTYSGGVWLHIIRDGSGNIQAYRSTDGITTTEVGTNNTQITDDGFLVIYVSDGNNSNGCEAVISNLTLT